MDVTLRRALWIAEKVGNHFLRALRLMLAHMKAAGKGFPGREPQGNVKVSVGEEDGIEMSKGREEGI